MDRETQVHKTSLYYMSQTCQEHETSLALLYLREEPTKKLFLLHPLTIWNWRSPNKPYSFLSICWACDFCRSDGGVIT